MKKTNFHIVKRDAVSWQYSMLIRAAAIIASLLVSAVVITLLTKKNPIEIYASMFKGAFGSGLRIWSLVQNIAVLSARQDTLKNKAERFLYCQVISKAVILQAQTVL